MFAKKQFGQNFITDKNLILKIISLLDSEPDQLVIEIGPGQGALTKVLVEKYRHVLAIEIDKDLESFLKAEIPNNNFELVMADILTFDLSNYLKNQKKIYKKISIISNLPYYITSEIIFKTFLNSEHLDKAIFMTQKEVAQRITATVGENNYNNLSVAAELYSHKKYEFTVRKQMFNPVPKVDSAIISFNFNKPSFNIGLEDKIKVNEMVRKLFNNRRKTILNNLGNLIGDKSRAQKILESLGIDFQLRPEVISTSEYLQIYKLVGDFKNED
ncbi:dimethyladenosine transferase [Spiroplasma sabaudiense Ar-1343]|uniref:Ribosomal RNA small subunit methyltransferase A n=1 Tax=Spiroplasma sabaudiense Ar-1343 TaxID=1276257 RepID=W6ABE5_9MOLU|nr:16S rRNA (adenine(1518)-N(6)/adenine(1519)-N(6))-dimethyltransferase RsmA [Spiroplasma sabaudiense]AHI54316.1 dimethyladenosine transferase [Spiroplasma sabaudiense Ar-1343]